MKTRHIHFRELTIGEWFQLPFSNLQGRKTGPRRARLYNIHDQFLMEQVFKGNESVLVWD